MMRFFNHIWGKTEEKQPLLRKGQNRTVQTEDENDKGKAPLLEDCPNEGSQNVTEVLQIEIRIPEKREEEKQQNPDTLDTMGKKAQMTKYCGYSLIGTGFAATILLLGAAGVSARSESRHPNIEHIASLISYFLSGFGITAFLSGGLILDYANKQFKRLSSQETHSSTEEAKSPETMPSFS